jgi:hypothetical protein
MSHTDPTDLTDLYLLCLRQEKERKCGNLLSHAESAEIRRFLTKTAKILSLISIFVKIMRLLPLMPDCKRASIIHHQQHTQHFML